MMNLIKNGPDMPEFEPDEAEKRRVFASEELFQNEREVIILHDGARYRLRMTKAGKLILNK